MNKSSHRIAVLLIVQLVAALALNACGLIVVNDNPLFPAVTTETTQGETTTETTVETVTTTRQSISMPESSRPLKPVEDVDYKAISDGFYDALPNRVFNDLAILITATDTEYYTPSDTSDAINTALVLRNNRIEERYDTRILSTESDIDTIRTGIKNSILADSYYTDIIAVPTSQIGRLQAEKLLMNLNTLPFIDLSKPYYDQNAVSQLSAGYGVYGIAGEYNKDIRKLYCVFYNKTLAAALGLGNMYNYVYDGEWTLDQFRTAAKTSGHGSLLPLNDYADFIFGALNETYFSTGYGYIPTPRFDTTKFGNILTKLKSLFIDDGTYLPADDSRADFYNGELLFYIGPATDLSWFYDMKDDWGILPLPKYDRYQKDFTVPFSREMTVLAVPVNNVNIDNTGLFIEAANAASYRHINRLYIDAFQRDTTRDSDSVNMLEYIADGRLAVDFAQAFSSGYAYLTPYTTDALHNFLNYNTKYPTSYAPSLLERNKQNF
jgi:hypothetical protein